MPVGLGSLLCERRKTQLPRHARYLVRPDRIDHPQLRVPANAVLPMQVDGPLVEGTSLRLLDWTVRAPRRLTLEGQLWSRAVRFEAMQSEQFHRATAAYVFSLDRYSQLSKLEQLALAMYAGAVSPVSSYLAIEPGVRPSTEGLDEGDIGTIGFGRGAGGFRPRSARVPQERDWEAITARARGTCHAVHEGGQQALVTLDVQDHELADAYLASDSDRHTYATCVVEALWEEQLPTHWRGDHTVTLRL